MGSRFDFPFRSFPWGGSGKLKKNLSPRESDNCQENNNPINQAVHDGSHSPFRKAENFLLVIRVAALLPAASSETRHVGPHPW